MLKNIYTSYPPFFLFIFTSEYLVAMVLKLKKKKKDKGVVARI